MEGHSQQCARSHHCQRQHIEPRAAAAESTHEARPHLQAQRVDKQHKAHIHRVLQDYRIDAQSAVPRQNAGKEHKRHTEAHALHLHLAKADAHGAYRRNEQQGVHLVGHAEHIVQPVCLHICGEVIVYAYNNKIMYAREANPSAFQLRS